MGFKPKIPECEVSKPGSDTTVVRILILYFARIYGNSALQFPWSFKLLFSRAWFHQNTTPAATATRARASEMIIIIKIIVIIMLLEMIAQSVWQWATVCATRVQFRKKQDIFLYSTASRPVLGPTQPPIQWVPVALSPEVKRPGREADHSSPSNVDVKNSRAIPPLLHWSSLRSV
jgi:hypothetical protein